MNPPLVVLMRYAYRDVVVPLSQPIIIGNTIISEIPLKQNTRVMIPITQYNRQAIIPSCSELFKYKPLQQKL